MGGWFKTQLPKAMDETSVAGLEELDAGPERVTHGSEAASLALPDEPGWCAGGVEVGPSRGPREAIFRRLLGVVSGTSYRLAA